MQVAPGGGLIYKGYFLGVFTNQFDESLQNTYVYINTAEIQEWISHTILLRSRQGGNDDINSFLDNKVHDQPAGRVNEDRQHNKVNENGLIYNNENGKHDISDFYKTEDENERKHDASVETDDKEQGVDNKNSNGNAKDAEVEYDETKVLESNYNKNANDIYNVPGDNKFITENSRETSVQFTGGNNIQKEHEQYEGKVHREKEGEEYVNKQEKPKTAKNFDEGEKEKNVDNDTINYDKDNMISNNNNDIKGNAQDAGKNPIDSGNFDKYILNNNKDETRFGNNDDNGANGDEEKFEEYKDVNNGKKDDKEDQEVNAEEAEEEQELKKKAEEE